MKVESLPEAERKSLYAAYKAFCTDFQKRADHLISNGATRTVATPDPIEVAFDVRKARDEHGYDLAMAKHGSELADTFAHAAGRTLTSVAWPALDQLEVEDGAVVLRIPLAAGKVD